MRLIFFGFFEKPKFENLNQNCVQTDESSNLIRTQHTHTHTRRGKDKNTKRRNGVSNDAQIR